MDGLMQPAVGPDGKKIEQESNVLLASIENMQYAVTVDVLQTVFSAFGTVQKIAIFEKNGSTQALIQYRDVTTAAVARDALEGHCIYDGGYCKLHLSYSRHTDLNVKAYSDKSRDYTIPEPSLLAAQQVPAGPTHWQNSQTAPMYSGTEYASAPGVPGQGRPVQVTPWDQNMQAGRPSYVSAPGTYPVSTVYSYPTSSGPSSYALPPGSSYFPQSGIASTRPTGGHHPNGRPDGASPSGQSPYYGHRV